MPFLNSTSGLKVYYEVRGQNGPWLVMLHGLGSNTEIWKLTVPAFQDHFRVLLLDFPGHGKSGTRVFHSMEYYAAILAEVMNALEIKTAHLMGLSMGCAVILYYALQYPASVSSLILQGPVGGITPPWLPWAWPKMLLLLSSVLLMSGLALILGKQRAVALLNAMPLQTMAHNDFLTRLESKASPYAAACLTLQTGYPPYVGKLAEILSPVLIIYGAHDLFPRRYFKYIYDHVGGYREQFEVPHAKHVAMLDNPEVYNKAVQAFLNR
ncbi:MAG: alpha/beta hydrolase [Vampirovibrionales bacterium]|nr:alpha/beta hydrolase [Vampirovibrionales bacterium]